MSETPKDDPVQPPVTPVEPLPPATPVSNGVYDKLKQSAQLVLPAIAALYFALAQYWHWANSEAVLGSIVAVNTFVGVVVTVLGIVYNKSDARFDGSVNVVIDPTTNNKTFQLVVNREDPYTLDQQKELTFKVNSPLN